jgi:hypothetical protein
LLGLPIYHPEPEGRPVTADQPIPHTPDGPPHGTLRGWSMGCRCILCKSAKTATTATAGDAGTLREGRTR